MLLKFLDDWVIGPTKTILVVPKICSITKLFIFYKIIIFSYVKFLRMYSNQTRATHASFMMM